MYGWQEGCSKSIHSTGNRNILQELWLAGAAIKVYSLQVIEVFYRMYGWQEGCSKRMQATGNRNILQELWLAGGSNKTAQPTGNRIVRQYSV